LSESLTSRDLLIGFLTFGSMFCTNFALKFVSFPLVVLAKSAKILPVMLIGWIRKTYKLHTIQYGLAFSITIGLIIFESDKLQNVEFDNIFGNCLILASLLFDGLVQT
jgi:drug/metabolite transporter (DMT)-like permease